jgi:transposase
MSPVYFVTQVLSTLSLLGSGRGFGSPVERRIRAMQTVRSFVGMDVHKETISISVAEDGRDGSVRFLGVIPNATDDVAKMAKRLSKHGELDFCYEASGCGYGIHRQLTALGHKCIVVAPSMIPRKPGERIKTDRGDSEKLAILHRSGDLTPVWVPDTTHEALRDLVRARVDASMHPMRARQQLLAFLLRHGRSYPTGKHTGHSVIAVGSRARPFTSMPMALSFRITSRRCGLHSREEMP